MSALAGLFCDEARRVGLARVLFLAGLCVWIAWKVLLSSVLAPLYGSPVNTALHLTSLALVCLSGVLGFKKERALAVFALALVAAAGVKLCSGSTSYIDLVLIFYAGRNVPFRDSARAMLLVTALMAAGVMALCPLGVATDYTWPRADGTVRHALGFLYCNKPGFYLLTCSMLWVYLRGERLGNGELVLICVLDVVQYLATDAKNPTLWVLVACLAALVLRRAPARDALGRLFSLRASKWLFVLLAVASLAATVAYDPASSLWQAAESASNKRLSQTSASLDNYGVAPFAPEVELVGHGLSTEGGIRSSAEANPDGDTNFIDNSYMNILVTEGAVPLVLVLAMCTAAMARASRVGDVRACALFAVVALFSVVDAELTTLWYDGMLLLMWDYAYAEAGDFLDGLRSWHSRNGAKRLEGGSRDAS